MHPAIIIGTVCSLWTWLWGRYHVPQNVFLVLWCRSFWHCLSFFFCFLWLFVSDTNVANAFPGNLDSGVIRLLYMSEPVYILRPVSFISSWFISSLMSSCFLLSSACTAISFLYRPISAVSILCRLLLIFLFVDSRCFAHNSRCDTGLMPFFVPL